MKVHSPHSRPPLGTSLRLVVAVLLCSHVPITAFAQVTPNYRGPAGRYTVQLPQGWKTTQMNGDAVQFASDSVFVTILVIPGAEVATTINAISAQTGKQWRNFAQARHGEAQFGGRTGQFETYSGVNPMGVDSFLQLLGVSDGSATYLMMTSASKADFTRLRNALDQIENSFAFGAKTNVTDALPPPPAGALNRPAAAKPAAGNPTAGITQPPAAKVASPQQPTTVVSGNPSAQGGGNLYRMKLVSIVDQRSFERPMTAMTMLIPSDWQFQGELRYGDGVGCHANLAHLVFRATSPDGRLAMELFPGNSWMWADDPGAVNMLRSSNQQLARAGARGCDIMATMNAENYLKQVVIPAARRGARITASEPLPDIAKQVQDEARRLEQIAASQGMRENVRADASRVRVGYDVNGQPTEEWFTAMTLSTAVIGPVARMGGMGQTWYYTNAADHIVGMRAPQGQLEASEKLFQLILGTMRMDPEWEGRVRQVIAQMMAKDASSAAERSAIIAQAGRAEAADIKGAFDNANKSRDHSMEGWSQYMRGVQSYKNPNTGETVELSNSYEHAWAGPDKQFVLSDSPNFNPNASMQGNWTQLVPAGR